MNQEPTIAPVPLPAAPAYVPPPPNVLDDDRPPWAQQSWELNREFKVFDYWLNLKTRNRGAAAKRYHYERATINNLAKRNLWDDRALAYDDEYPPDDTYEPPVEEAPTPTTPKTSGALALIEQTPHEKLVALAQAEPEERWNILIGILEEKALIAVEKIDPRKLAHYEIVEFVKWVNRMRGLHEGWINERGQSTSSQGEGNSTTTVNLNNIPLVLMPDNGRGDAQLTHPDALPAEFTVRNVTPDE